MRLIGRTRPGGREDLPAGFLAREEKKRPNPVTGGRLAVVASVLLAVLGALAAADYLAGSGEIHRGVSAGEVSLGGMSRAEARAALEEHARENLDEIALRGRGGASIRASGIGLQTDPAATAGRAYAVGREGDVFTRVWRRLGATLGGVEVEPAVTYDPGALRAEVSGVAAGLGRDSRSARVRVSGPGVGVVEAREGYRVDVGGTTDGVERAISDLSGEAALVGETLAPAVGTAEAERARRAVQEPLILAHGDRRWTISPDRLAGALRLSGGEARIDRAALGGEISYALGALEESPVEARMVSGEDGTVDVVPGRGGREIRMERLLDEVETGIFEGRHRYEVPVSTVAPELTTEEAEAARPHTMLGEFETSYEVYDDVANRTENLRVASERVDGTILAPGETFSFNEAAAPLERYEPSEVIVDGRLDTALGGGLCQVASTLYMAANYAGLEVVERHPHYAELPYIRPGFDATVWFGSLDLKFRNNTDSYLLLEERVDDQTGEITARIYGQPTGREVEMSSRKLSDSDETTRWRSTRKVTDEGRVVERGTLSIDTYEPLKPEALAPTGRGA